MGDVLRFPGRHPEPTLWDLAKALAASVLGVATGWRAPQPPPSEFDEARSRDAAAKVDDAIHNERRRLGVEE